MGKSVLYVGLDVHKMSIDVAIAEAGPGAEVRFYGQIGGDLDSLDRVIRKLRATGAQLQFAYEAGPCGYQVYRHLTAQGWPCLVAAPSLIPRRPGDRIKCDRRDALSLARLFRAGELTPVKVPDPDDEAIRDLTRAREDAVSVERRAKQRTGALLLRHGRRYPGKTTWGRGHWRWLLQQAMEHPAQQIVLQEYLDAVRQAGARVLRLTGQIRELIREYVPLRIVTNDLADIRARMARSVEIQAKIWSITEGLARAAPDSDVLALFISSLLISGMAARLRIMESTAAVTDDRIMLFCSSISRSRRIASTRPLPAHVRGPRCRR